MIRFENICTTTSVTISTELVSHLFPDRKPSAQRNYPTLKSYRCKGFNLPVGIHPLSSFYQAFGKSDVNGTTLLEGRVKLACLPLSTHSQEPNVFKSRKLKIKVST
jgi:hypothetical protein